MTQPAIGGVTLEQYAIVTAAETDGIAREEALAFVDVDPNTWEAAEEAWGDAMLRDLEKDLTLTFALDEAQRKARELWVRPVPPIDEDLRSWLDFLRAFGSSPAPLEMLEGLNLTPADLGRLQRAWATRMTGDEALAKEAAAILASPPQPVNVPPVPPPTLPAQSTQDGTGTGFFGALTDAELPFAGEAAMPVRVAPPIAVPLPKAPADNLDATAAAEVVLAPESLPFVDGAAPAAPPAAVPVPPPEPAPPSQPVFAPPVAVPPAVRVVVQPAPAATVDATAVGGAPAMGDSLPFDDGAAAAPPPSGRLDAPSEDAGETAFLTVGQLGMDALPFDGDDLDRTGPAMAPLEEEPVPFDPNASAVPPVPISHRPHPQKGGTVQGGYPNPEGATPFKGEEGEALVPGGLTLQQYAAVEEELSLSPNDKAAILARYGIDEGRRQAHADSLVRALIASPTLKKTWDELRAAYRAWRQKGGGA